MKTLHTEIKWLKWIILSAGFYINTFVFASLFSLASLLKDMLDKFHENVSKTATVQALFSGIGLSAGILAGMLISRFGMRKISIIGAILSSSGFILSFFSSSLMHLYVCIGVIAGTGSSVMIIAGITAVGEAFSGSQRLIALALQNAGVSVGVALTPYLYHYFVENYGLNGAFLLMSGIYLNCVPAALMISVREKNKITQPSEANTNSQQKSSQTCAYLLKENLNQLKKTMLEVMRPPFILTAMANAIIMGSLSGLFLLILDMLKWKGSTSEEGLLAFPTAHGVGFIARLLPGIAKQIKGVNSFVFPIVFSLCGAFGQMIFLKLSGRIPVLIGCALLGLSIAGVISGTNIAVTKILNTELAAVGFGIIYSSVGILTMICGPVYGAIKDATQSYEVVLYVAFTFQLLGTVFFLMAIYARKVLSKGSKNTMKGQDNFTLTIDE